MSLYLAKSIGWQVRTAKIQTSLRIRTLDHSLCVLSKQPYNIGPLATHRAPINDSNKSAQVPRLIWPICTFGWTPGFEVIKNCPCSTQLSTKFILLINVGIFTFVSMINVKMPSIVGFLTFISMINTTSERLEARNFFICRCFSFCELSMEKQL